MWVSVYVLLFVLFKFTLLHCRLLKTAYVFNVFLRFFSLLELLLHH